MKALILPSLLCVFIVSCASTPTSRIQKHPAKFANLSESQKELVQEGRIEEGMHKDGVFIAMGNPDRVTETLENGDEKEEWNYFSLEPVYNHRFGVTIGLGSRYYDRYDRGYYRRNSFWGGPSIDYVPRLSAVVQFEDDYVDGYKIRNSQ